MDPRMLARMEQEKNSYEIPDALNFAAIPWPNIKEYGAEHGQKSAQLSKYLATAMNLDAKDKKLLWAVSILHDVGRMAPWGEPDPEHRRRSADIARNILQRSSQEYSHHEVIDEVCYFIANHDLDEPTNDPRMQVFHDTERLEACRVFPNTKRGLQIIKEVCQPEKLYLPICKHKEFIQGWMGYRGWNI